MCSFRELDHAMLRRLEKRILVGLPSSPARQAMISHWLPPVSSTEGGVELQTELDYKTLAEVCYTEPKESKYADKINALFYCMCF